MAEDSGEEGMNETPVRGQGPGYKQAQERNTKKHINSGTGVLTKVRGKGECKVNDSNNGLYSRRSSRYNEAWSLRALYMRRILSTKGT